jgi:hypothetical protein
MRLSAASWPHAAASWAHAAAGAHASSIRTHAFSGTWRGRHVRQGQPSFPGAFLHAGMMFGADSLALLDCFGSAQFIAVLDAFLPCHQLAAIDLFAAGGLLLYLRLLFNLLLQLLFR